MLQPLGSKIDFKGHSALGSYTAVAQRIGILTWETAVLVTDHEQAHQQVRTDNQFPWGVCASSSSQQRLTKYRFGMGCPNRVQQTLGFVAGG